MSQRVLVIGATSAVAMAYARLQRAAGCELYLVARNPARLAALAEELGGCVAGHRVADLDDHGANESLVHAVLDDFGPVDRVLIAHGYLGPQLQSERDWGEARAIFATNLLSPVSLLIPLANRLEAQGNGHIGVITSVAGERGRPRNYTYGAAKGGLTRYLEGVRSRLYESAVVIHNFKLGPVDSPMTVDHEKNRFFTTPERAAELIDAAFASGRHEHYVPGFWRFIMLGVRYLPEPIFQRLKFLSGR